MIRWNDNYITGIEKLDKEHQQLFQMADQVLNKLRERGDEANYRIFLVEEMRQIIVYSSFGKL